MAQAPQPPAAETSPPAAKPDANQVECITTGSFFENSDMTGQLLQAGQTVTFDKSRASQLRAAGLIRYTDEKAEKAEAANDPAPSTDQGEPVITTRSFRRDKA